MHLVFPLTVFLLTISGPLFQWVYHPDLRPASRIFDIFLLLAVPRMMFPQSVLLGLGLNRFTLYGSLWEWPVHVGLSLTLIGPLGMYGPAWATLTAYVFGKGVLVVYALRAGVRLSRYHELRLWTVYTLLILATFGVKWAYTA
jgi:O-antigen/teichoic acid export membrane protein